MLFPYLWLYLLIETQLGRRRLNGGQVFLLGGCFSFLYDGLFTKSMQDGAALSGLNWAAVLGGPVEWGMIAVLWFHCLESFLPRNRQGAPLWRVVFLSVIAAGAAVIFLWKTLMRHYRVEYMLGPMWFLDDAALAAAAAWLWSVFRRSLRQDGGDYVNPPWVWAAVGVGLWLSGSRIVAQACDGLSLSPAPHLAAQLVWMGALAAAFRVLWRDRHAGSAEPLPRGRLALAAAGWRVAGALLWLAFFGAGDDPRLGFWSVLLFDLPSQGLFTYAFLTSRLEV